jgi:hypothetical protein
MVGFIAAMLAATQPALACKPTESDIRRTWAMYTGRIDPISGKTATEAETVARVREVLKGQEELCRLGTGPEKPMHPELQQLLKR